jgi:DNA-binding NarL/FixJ family response regulator
MIGANTSQIHLLLIHDHALIREALCYAFQHAAPSLRLLGAWASTEINAGVAEYDPAIVLLDSSITRIGEGCAMTMVQRTWPESNLILVGAIETTERLHQALDVGVRGFFSNRSNFAQVLQVIDLVAQGGIACDRESAQMVQQILLARSAQSRLDANSSDGLSPREREVVVLLQQGLSNRQIAEGLGIAPKTVESHVRAILRKRRVPSRSDLVCDLHVEAAA